MKSLLLNEEEPIYGKYGMLRKQFLKEHRSAKYQYLLLTGKLTEHLNQIDQEASEYSCAVTPQVRQTGKRLSGLAGTAYASLLT